LHPSKRIFHPYQNIDEKEEIVRGAEWNGWWEAKGKKKLKIDFVIRESE
jgi:hypothetical protein